MLLLCLFLLIVDPAPSATPTPSLREQCNEAVARCNVESKGYSHEFDKCIYPFWPICNASRDEPTARPTP